MIPSANIIRLTSVTQFTSASNVTLQPRSVASSVYVTQSTTSISYCYKCCQLSLGIQIKVSVPLYPVVTQPTSVASSVYVAQSATIVFSIISYCDKSYQLTHSTDSVPVFPVMTQSTSAAISYSATLFSKPTPECVNFETITTSLLKI